jgi:transposase-like protein
MKKRRSAEQIVGLLRQADVDLGKGATVPDVCRRLGISQQTYYRWRTGHRRQAVVAAAWIRRWRSDFRSSKMRIRG